VEEEQNSLNVKAAGTYNYHFAIKGWDRKPYLRVNIIE
jgi:hypothetical protein